MNIQNETIRSALLTIAEKNGGYLSPDAVVSEAKDPNHPLHTQFLWDDSEAADLYRRAQAGHLIRRVKLAIMRPANNSRSVDVQVTRAFQSRPSARTADQGYEPVQLIMADDEKREEMIAQVLSELSAYRNRYASLMALSSIWDAIDEARLEHDAVTAKRPSQQAKAASAAAVNC